jgi:hypothetical protein
VLLVRHTRGAQWFTYICATDLLLALPVALFAAVFVSYALVSLTDAVLYTNPEKVTPAVAEHLKAGGVVVRPYEQLVADVKAKAAAKARIAMDMSKVSIKCG